MKSGGERSEELRWEWEPSPGSRVRATLDAAGRTESVYLDDVCVSRAPRGARREGHAVALPRGGVATVTFDPSVVVCILRIDGMEIAPLAWPAPRRGPASPAPPRRAPPALAVLGLVIVGALALVIGKLASTRDVVAETRTHRADNGLFVAHLPSTYVERVGSTSPGGSLLTVHRGDAAAVILARRGGDGARDRWAVQQRLGAEALAALPRASGAYRETSREEGTCAGEPGAIVQAEVTDRAGRPARTWACGFVHGEAAYLLSYLVPDAAASEQEAELRGILDATELTNLAETAPR